MYAIETQLFQILWIQESQLKRYILLEVALLSFKHKNNKAIDQIVLKGLNLSISPMEVVYYQCSCSLTYRIIFVTHCTMILIGVGLMP